MRYFLNVYPAGFVYTVLRFYTAWVDTERSQDLATRFAIRSIPTLALFRGGREVARQSGAMDAGRLAAWVESQLRPA